MISWPITFFFKSSVILKTHLSVVCLILIIKLIWGKKWINAAIALELWTYGCIWRSAATCLGLWKLQSCISVGPCWAKKYWVCVGLTNWGIAAWLHLDVFQFWSRCVETCWSKTTGKINWAGKWLRGTWIWKNYCLAFSCETGSCTP